MLLMQNKDGRFGNYEQARGGAWMELLSPADALWWNIATVMGWRLGVVPVGGLQ